MKPSNDQNQIGNESEEPPFAISDFVAINPNQDNCCKTTNRTEQIQDLHNFHNVIRSSKREYRLCRDAQFFDKTYYD